jgi:CRISPR-associated protein (TIGR02584 family)
MAKREILIVTGGLTPQVVTETVYALVKRKADPLVPTKIVCAVTGQVRQRFENELDAALARLRRELAIEADWAYRPISWERGREGLFVAVPRSAADEVVNDIRSDGEAVAFGNLSVRIVRHETADADARVHLSLAGGRKTMSFHGGAAMSLFGRPTDELSHVLVHPQHFENCPDFWFPTAASTPVGTRDGAREIDADARNGTEWLVYGAECGWLQARFVESEGAWAQPGGARQPASAITHYVPLPRGPRQSFDAKDARVELGPIPFIQVRDWLPPGLREQPLDYGSYVAQINALRAGAVPLFLELVTAGCRVRIGNLADFTLPNSEFALYQLMAEWQQNGHGDADSQGIGPGHRGWLRERLFTHPEQYDPNPVERYKAIYKDSFFVGTGEDIDNRLSHAPGNEKQRRDHARLMRGWKSKLLTALQDRLHHPDLADRFGAPLRVLKVANNAPAETAKAGTVFGLRLDPREIVIHPEEPRR